MLFFKTVILFSDIKSKRNLFFDFYFPNYVITQRNFCEAAMVGVSVGWMVVPTKRRLQADGWSLVLVRTQLLGSSKAGTCSRARD